jgi:hypothetical protein
MSHRRAVIKKEGFGAFRAWIEPRISFAQGLGWTVGSLKMKSGSDRNRSDPNCHASTHLPIHTRSTLRMELTEQAAWSGISSKFYSGGSHFESRACNWKSGALDASRCALYALTQNRMNVVWLLKCTFPNGEVGRFSFAGRTSLVLRIASDIT